jgi:hypothetical protein
LTWPAVCGRFVAVFFRRTRTGSVGVSDGFRVCGMSGTKAKQRVEVTCPCCQAKLLVDGATGLVLHTETRKSSYSFDDALQREKERKAKTDELFAKAVENEKRRQSSLEEKFQAALRSKDELDEPPPRPWDLD